jgi:hypothetical protein
MRVMRRRSQALLTGLVMVGASLSLALVTSTPAHAAYGPCNSVSLRSVGNHEYVRVPIRVGNGLDCYMRQGHGTTAAVRAMQEAIVTCYSGTAAARLIRDSGGADGVYGAGTTSAVRSLQRNQLGFTGSDVDGVFGPKTRKAMRWQLRGSSGAPLYPWQCKNPTQV